MIPNGANLIRPRLRGRAPAGIGQALALDMARSGAACIALVDYSDRVMQVAREMNKEAGRRKSRMPFALW